MENIDNCNKFDETFLEVLDKHASLKKKLLRANHASYDSKALRKAIMRRSYLEKLYFKNRTENSLRTFKKQRNFWSRLYKKERKYFVNSLNPSFVKDNKLFWKTVFSQIKETVVPIYNLLKILNCYKMIKKLLTN